ncbi:hypothetical protein AOP6_1851 [Desulfuromonas sp. AOP6]|nr:hypothetical protein AOP6_1851 [Desulfuromonas sp. AOP6]
MLPLKRSPQYERRIRFYVENIAERYGVAVAETFIAAVERQEKLIKEHNQVGVNVPYILAGRQVILKELTFDSGPMRYCLIYEVLDDCVPLISLWHGVGARSEAYLTRLWRRSDPSRQD